MIWHIFIYFGLVFWNGDSDIQLETANELLDLSWRNTQVARDGSLLYAGGVELRHWDADGKLRKILKTDGEGNPFRGIAGFYFDAARGIYWIVDGSRSQSSFFDREGNSLGMGYWSAAFPQPDGDQRVYFRSLIPVGGRIFALDGRQLDPSWASPLPKVLLQVDFRVTDSGVEVWSAGPAFGKISEQQKRYSYDFKRHWIVQSGYSKTFLVVDQLSTHLRFFQPKPQTAITDGLYPSGKPAAIVMRERVAPPPPESKRECKTQECYGNWFNSFTRIQGFYRLGRRFLVGYGIPPATAGGITRLGLQKIDRRGIALGKSQIRVGYLMGTWRGRAYILEEHGPPENRSYRVAVVTL